MLKDKLAKDAKWGQTQTSMLSNKGRDPRRTNVGFDQVSKVPLDWSMERCEEAKKAKQVAQSKQGKHINITRSGERCISNTLTPRRCISQVVTSKETLGGKDVTTQAQAHEGHEAWQSQDLERLTWR